MNSDPLIVARVEAYLDQILAPLTHRLSPFRREELRRELREHLWARVDAYRELGQSEDEAVTEALRQFGGAEDFLRQWQREWMKTTSRVTWPEVRHATRLALPLSLSALLLAFLLQVVAGYEMNTNRDGPSGWLYDHFNTFNDVFGCLCLLFPVALGLTAGRRTGNSAALGVFMALTVDFLFGCLMEVIGSYLWEFSNFRQFIRLIPTLAILWMPIACTTAWVTGWRTRRSKTRLLA